MHAPMEAQRAFEITLSCCYPDPGNGHVRYACEHFATTVSKNEHVQRALHRYVIGNPSPSMEMLASMATKAERSEEKIDPTATSGETLPRAQVDPAQPGHQVGFPLTESRNSSTSGIHRDLWLR